MLEFKIGDKMKIAVGVSNRHVHLNEEDLNVLFGDNYSLTKMRDIKQKGQFVCEETVNIETEKSKIENVRVLGPIRPYTQVEISRTDAYKLGINPPIRTSGDLDGSAHIKIIGPKGVVTKEKGCIQANRHIHITKELRKAFGYNDISEVMIYVNGEKGGFMDHVYFKESEDAVFELHIDTDDANAFMLKNGDFVDIIKKP